MVLTIDELISNSSLSVKLVFFVVVVVVFQQTMHKLVIIIPANIKLFSKLEK